jgi:hypothetical protein
MDLDELLDDNQTTDGKMTLNESAANALNARNWPEQQRMVSTANDGQSMRFHRRQKVSKNYKEMMNSIERSNKRPAHRADQLRSFESGKSGAMNSTTGLTKSLASHLVENKEKLLQLRDERDRTIEREKNEQAATITIQSESEFQGAPESVITRTEKPLSEDLNDQQ